MTATDAINAAQFDTDVRHYREEWTGVEWDLTENCWAIYRHGYVIGWSDTREAAWERLRELDPHLRAAS